ncbi:MAG: hypothetical protein A3E85_05050 [Gammaproteobacteria bacterium RIFCSPHIGHO2_12_FULL_45_12]|nr:MAG: hypothetical protein A3E85_05050 [Gammaproteobacteria bacterium RIFCSPHIGHO2_12_FULL_45_12]
MQSSLLLLPGLMCDASVWRDQINHLRQFVNIIVPDLSRASTPQAMVAAVLHVAPDSFLLAGHSMGGWVALEVMRHAPGRVQKLCLANTSAQLDSPEKAQARRDMINEAEQGRTAPLIDQLARRFVYQKACLPAVKSILFRNQHALIPQERAMLMREDCVPLLQTIACQSLVIHSVEDAIFGVSDSEQLVSHMLDAELVIIKKAGHMSLMEQPEAFTNALLAWLLKYR